MELPTWLSNFPRPRPPVRRIMRFGPIVPERNPILTPMNTYGRICKVKRKSYKGSLTLEWHIPSFFNSTLLLPASGCICSPPTSFLHTSFRLAYYQRDIDVFSFHVLFFEHIEFQATFTLAIGKTDGSAENLVSGLIRINQCVSRQSCEVKFTDLRSRSSEYLLDGLLTIKCSLKKDTSGFSEPGNKMKPLKFINLEKLSDNFRGLFGDEETCDAVVKVCDKEYKVHRYVLISRCPVFAALFKHDTLEKKTGVIVIEDCDPEAFKKFLEYLYCGKVEDLSFENAFGLYQISDKYNFEELKEFCVEYLSQCLTVENFSEVALFADKFDITTLMSCVQEFFDENVNQILVTPEWENLIEKYFSLANNFLINMPKVEC